MPLTQTIACLYMVVETLVAVYFGFAKLPMDPKTGHVPRDKVWSQAVLQIGLILVVGVMCLTRLGRNGVFWTIGGAYILFTGILFIAMIIQMGVRIRYDDHSLTLMAGRFRA